MKLFVFLLCVTLGCAFPFEDTEVSEDGWFVPQLNGSLQWVTKEEAAASEHQVSPRLFFNKLKVKFYLYTQENPEKGQQIFIDDVQSLKASNFNPANPTRFTIHGWQNDHKSEVNTVIRDAFLEISEYNIIAVDWDQKFSLNYMKSKNNVPKVGEKVAEMIDFLVAEGNMSLDDLHVIGHSLGAHVAGFAGKGVRSGQIHTIIGLDPAWPLYTFSGCAKRLCDTDAGYVESIHTNGGLLGFLHPIGKAAFYTNGGKLQPGCGLDIGGVCSHLRSFYYYAESIKQNDFISKKCPSWKFAVKKSCKENTAVVKLGGAMNFAFAEGHYFTPVNKRTPYGKGNVK